MSDTQSPFDAPEFAAAMAEKGVVHRPGVAAEIMQGLAPLLAAEGIDLENPDEDVDLDTLNAALARATEQYNLELLTHRDSVLFSLDAVVVIVAMTTTAAAGQ